MEPARQNLQISDGVAGVVGVFSSARCFQLVAVGYIPLFFVVSVLSVRLFDKICCVLWFGF